MEYTTLDVKIIAHNFLYKQDTESTADFIEALKRIEFDEGSKVVLGLYMCDLTTYEINQILNQMNYIQMLSASLILEESFFKIVDVMNGLGGEQKTRIIKTNTLKDFLVKDDFVIPTIEIVKDIQKELSKFDKKMDEALKSKYEYIEEPIQLRRQEEMVSARIKYNFIDYDRKYHAVSEYKDELGESIGKGY